MRGRRPSSAELVELVQEVDPSRWRRLSYGMMRLRPLWLPNLVQFVLPLLSALGRVELSSALPGDCGVISSDEAVAELPELSASAEWFEGLPPRHYTLHAESGGFSITGADAELALG